MIFMLLLVVFLIIIFSTMIFSYESSIKRLIIGCVLFAVILICLIISIIRFNTNHGSIIIEKTYQNIIKIDDVNDTITYKKGNVVLEERFDYFIDKSKLNDNSVIKIIIYKSTNYEFWILGYKNYKSIALIE